MRSDGIDSIRRSLQFGAREEALLRSAAPRLLPEIPGWTERFYARVAVDPVAMALLKDEGRIIRLKRSFGAWLHELFALPFDAAYERARAGIGRTHVRIEMPQYLMVTSMGGVRRDAAESVARLWAAEPETGHRVMCALDQVLDLELALMLEQYRRRSREVAHEVDRALFTQRFGLRLARDTRTAVDTALCYVELLRRATGDEGRDRWAARLEEALKGVARASRRVAAAPPGAADGPDACLLADVCARALSNVSLPDTTSVEVTVDPPHLSARVHRSVLELCLEGLVRDAAKRADAGTVRLAVAAAADRVVFEVTDAGPAWPPEVHGPEDALDLPAGPALALAEHVADLHGGSIELYAPPGGGAGVRVRLGPPRDAKEIPDADLVEDPGRAAP